jgi:hypothetical protein
LIYPQAAGRRSITIVFRRRSYDNEGDAMPRNRIYALAVLVTIAVVAGPALAKTVQSHAAKQRTITRIGPRGPRGARGARGLRGVPGATGPAGAPGAPGANGGGAASLLRTVVVSPSAVGPSADGALLAATLAAINASATSPYLVWIEPGVYDLGTTPLSIPSHVDVQGSGQDVTTIEGEGPLAVLTAPGTELRQLTVTDTNTSGSAEAIDAGGGLRDVTATASGTSAATAVLADDPTMPIVDVTASATASASSSFVQAIDTQNGAQIDGGSFTATEQAGVGQAAAVFAESATTVSDATLRATGGATPYPVDVVATSATVAVSGSTLIGTGGFFVAAGDTLGVGASQIPGVATSGSGLARCPDDWLADYDGASSDCS